MEEDDLEDLWRDC